MYQLISSVYCYMLPCGTVAELLDVCARQHLRNHNWKIHHCMKLSQFKMTTFSTIVDLTATTDTVTFFLFVVCWKAGYSFFLCLLAVEGFPYGASWSCKFSPLLKDPIVQIQVEHNNLPKWWNTTTKTRFLIIYFSSQIFFIIAHCIMKQRKSMTEANAFPSCSPHIVEPWLSIWLKAI